MSTPPRRALVIYARAPVAGSVKTRLQPVFTAVEALALYEAMLADLVERVLGAGIAGTTVFLAWSEPCEPPATLAGLINKVRLEGQQGDDLGERMARTLKEKLQSGFTQVVMIGADAPNLPIDYLRLAFEHLTAAEIVLGPAADGGYYLLGARRLHPILFQKMPWGTDKVLSITRQRVKSSKIPHAELPPWYDVDTPDDVARLWSDLRHMNAKHASDRLTRTTTLLAELMRTRTQAP